ncbi:hypothetical protein [Hydrogenoanaerobacterium sp.]|uniref:hypothetical protein n=1 Tax=Hydrogenoanaerobacterium sp. TaxID=2953763 RepID=UPI00289FDE43|nr:hypothetical protein [Hydrogenoanaerobacterium sp.]
MNDYPYPYPWKKLPGTAAEMAFLGERFAKMSIREHLLLEGSSQFVSIETAADLINLTEQLDSFTLYYGVKDDATLGKYIATYQHQATPDQLLFIDLNQWGRDIREKNGGVFVSGGYVERHYADHEVYTGKNLEQLTGESASVRIKVASGIQSAGLWVRLPDYEISTGEPDELSVAMSELGITKWSRAVLLEAECCLDNITDIANQYESLEELIRAGNNLGYVLAEQGQGMSFFHERFQAAMELEGCTRLDEALDISQNLDCYDFIPSEQHWEKFGRDLAQKRGLVHPSSPIGMYFDYAGYCKAEIEALNLQPCEDGYIARNEKGFIREFSKEPQTQGQILDHSL